MQRWAVPAPKLSAEERKHAECEMDDPEGNLVIGERVVHENQCMFPQTSTVGTVVPTFLAGTQHHTTCHHTHKTVHDTTPHTPDGISRLLSRHSRPYTTNRCDYHGFIYFGTGRFCDLLCW